MKNRLIQDFIGFYKVFDINARELGKQGFVRDFGTKHG